MLSGAALVSLASNQVTFRVDLSVQKMLGNFTPENGDSVVVSGTFSPTDWTTTSLLTPSGTNPDVYTGTFDNDVAVGVYENHKFIINPGGNSTGAQLIWESGNDRFFQVTAASQTLPIAYFDNVSSLPLLTNGITPDEFIAGADLSHLHFFEDRGVQYRVNGQTQDALGILKDRGFNCVRLRLFTSSATQAATNPYNFTNNLDYTLPLAVRVKSAGLKVLLDFHYSDSWADPGKQNKPATWAGLDFADLKSQIRSYTSNTIHLLTDAGARPDFVQVGNEITPGLLWSDGRVGGTYDNAVQWSQLAQLLTNAIQGVKDVPGNPHPKIIIHIDRGGDWNSTKWYFDNLAAMKVDFDIIGESYYPWWHGSLGALRTCLNNAAVRYDKPVMVMETAFPRTDSTNIFGIPASTNGQVQFVIELAKVVKGVPGNLGAGVFWWAAEYQQVSGANLAGFDRRSLFGTNGDVLPAAEVFGSMTSPINLSPTRSNDLLILNWPLSGAGLSLQSTSNLVDPIWTDATNEILTTNPVFSTEVPLSDAPAQFFRLQSE